MPTYSPFPYNKEVMDVLCCVIRGINSVKGISGELKQPQSTVSEKMRFLVKNRAIVKKKWFFKPNWNALCRTARKEIRGFILSSGKDYENWPIAHSKLSKKMLLPTLKKVDYFVDFFNDRRVRKILETYAFYLIREGSMPKKPISDIVLLYFDGLMQTDENELKEISPTLLRLRRFVSYKSMEKSMFLDVERDLRKEM